MKIMEPVSIFKYHLGLFTYMPKDRIDFYTRNNIHLFIDLSSKFGYDMKWSLKGIPKWRLRKSFFWPDEHTISLGPIHLTYKSKQGFYKHK